MIYLCRLSYFGVTCQRDVLRDLN